MHDRTPFVYSVRNRTTGLFYYGSRYGKGCHPSDLWTTYFTSSKMVEMLVKTHGKDDFDVYIIQSFPGDIESARRLELSLLQSSKSAPQCINICRSTGLVDIAQASRAGKVGGAVVKANCLGILNPLNPSRVGWASLGGKAGGAAQAIGKIGIHSQTREERLLLSSQGGRKATETGRNKIVAVAGFASTCGKKGGLGNAGFVWYNDGQRSFKYTAAAQQSMPLADLLASNPLLSKGRSPYEPITCPHCGKSGAPQPMAQHHFDKCPVVAGPLSPEHRLKLGATNKGARTYNDGVRSFKYTAVAQQSKSFEEFLADNTQFTPGLIRKPRTPLK